MRLGRCVGLCGICFSLQSVWKRLTAQAQMFKAVFFRVYPVSRARQAYSKNLPV